MEKVTDETVRQRIAGKAIIQHMSKVLILREAKQGYAEGANAGKYQFPGGRIKPGEPFMRGLEREIFEETGLRVAVGDPVYVGEWSPVINGDLTQIVGVFFACEAETDAVRLSAEHDRYAWIDPAASQQYELMTPEDKALAAFLK